MGSQAVFMHAAQARRGAVMSNVPTPLDYQYAVRQAADESHLRVLSICHYIAGGLAMLFSSLFIIHIVIGVLALSNPNFLGRSPGPGGPPASVFAYMFIAVGSTAV